MFSEKEILIHCKECQGHCDRIKKCPLKMDSVKAGNSGLFPALPSEWEFAVPGTCRTTARTSREYALDALLNGLDVLNDHMQA